MDEPAEYAVHRPDHWVFQGTGLKRDATFGAKDTIVMMSATAASWSGEGLPFPTHRDGLPDTFEVLATCLTRCNLTTANGMSSGRKAALAMPAWALHARRHRFHVWQHRLVAWPQRWRRNRDPHHPECAGTVGEVT